jgi:hypothetical protein
VTANVSRSRASVKSPNACPSGLFRWVSNHIGSAEVEHVREPEAADNVQPEEEADDPREQGEEEVPEMVGMIEILLYAIRAMVNVTIIR